MQKYYFFRTPNFGLKMSGKFILNFFLNHGILESIIGCFMHEYSEMIFILIWFSQYQNKMLTKCLEIFCFWKMVGFSSQNIQELGSQVPDFLNVCSHSPFQGPWWSRRVPWALVDFQNDQNLVPKWLKERVYNIEMVISAGKRLQNFEVPFRAL